MNRDAFSAISSAVGTLAVTMSGLFADSRTPDEFEAQPKRFI